MKLFPNRLNVDNETIYSLITTIGYGRYAINIVMHAGYAILEMAGREELGVL